jgi:hypothetical protein
MARERQAEMKRRAMQAAIGEETLDTLEMGLLKLVRVGDRDRG